MIHFRLCQCACAWSPVRRASNHAAVLYCRAWCILCAWQMVLVVHGKVYPRKNYGSKRHSKLFPYLGTSYVNGLAGNLLYSELGTITADRDLVRSRFFLLICHLHTHLEDISTSHCVQTKLWDAPFCVVRYLRDLHSASACGLKSGQQPSGSTQPHTPSRTLCVLPAKLPCSMVPHAVCCVVSTGSWRYCERVPSSAKD